MGGRGQKGKISTLQAFKNNAKQFHNALQEGQRRGASIVEYSDITGATVRRYWNGSNWVEKNRRFTMVVQGGIEHRAHIKQNIKKLTN